LKITPIWLAQAHKFNKKYARQSGKHLPPVHDSFCHRLHTQRQNPYKSGSL
jgi:hypothetical protein